jgi:hypothetical protein
LGEIGIESLLSRDPVWDDPLLAPLAQHAHRTAAIIDIVNVQPDEFPNSHTRGVQKLENASVAEVHGIVVIRSHQRN